MSFVVTAPELVEAAAQDLSGIRSELSEATAAATAPTTGIEAAGADEISAAIANLFRGYGQEFHALSAQAAAFHEEFVNLLNGGASAYLGTEAANAVQTLGSLNAPARSLLGELKAGASGQTAPIVQELETFGATVAAPYETLFTNTATNLQSLGNAFLTNPAPLVRQIITNQIGYAE